MPVTYKHKLENIRRKVWSVGPRNYSWIIQDYFGVTISRGSGCKTRFEAFTKIVRAKRAYLKTLPKKRTRTIIELLNQMNPV